MPFSGEISAGARSSPLSKAQVSEVLLELQRHHPEVVFNPVWVQTTGDCDRKRSLRDLEKTDFFTKEIDEKLLQGDFRIAIHSAKDLPEPLPPGLRIVALTKGVDPSDSLVYSQDPLPEKARIGTSSKRREEMLLRMRPDFQCVDIRGTIEERLQLLRDGKLDGVVIAEAALIRLGLAHCKRILLQGQTAPLQGRLAVVAREGDEEMEELFSAIDARRILHLGLEVPKRKNIVHLPLIQIVPRLIPNYVLEDMPEYTHLIFTSPSAVEVFFRAVDPETCREKQLVAVGKTTMRALKEKAFDRVLTASEERQEGVIALLQRQDLEEAYMLWPRSSQARGGLEHFLRASEIRHQTCDLYDTKTQIPDFFPDPNRFDEIFFSSPSAVRAFLEIRGELPDETRARFRGVVTKFAFDLAKKKFFR